MGQDTQTTTSNYQNARVELLHDTLLEIGEQNMLLNRFGRVPDQTVGHGTTQSWFRYNRLDIPLGTLTEGVPPGKDTLSLTKISASISQRGQRVGLTDRVILETDHMIIPEAMMLLGDARAKLFERVYYETLLTGTNVIYAGSGTSRSDVTAGASDVLDTTEVKRALSQLRTGDNVNGAARPFTSGPAAGTFPCVVHENVMLDLREDSSYLNAAEQQDIEELRGSQYGAFKWQGVTFLTTNWMPEIQEMGDWTDGSDDQHDGTLTGNTAGSSYAVDDDASIVITAKHKKRTFEEFLYTTANQLDGGTVATTYDASVKLPSNDSYVYNIYEGSAQGSSVAYADHKLAYSNQEAGSTVTVQKGDGTGEAPPEAPASGETVYPCFFFGQDAFAKPQMAGSKEGVSGTMAPKIVGAKGESTDSDPLAQLVQMGYKEFFDSVILNDNFLVRVEVASNFGG